MMLNYFGTISALVGSLFKSFPILQCIRNHGVQRCFRVGKICGRRSVGGKCHYVLQKFHNVIVKNMVQGIGLTRGICRV